LALTSIIIIIVPTRIISIMIITVAVFVINIIIVVIVYCPRLGEEFKILCQRYINTTSEQAMAMG
jgi:hypothetical protein